ncbi:MAG: isoprenylcysteine carboxylmethyltransferase family protein [Herpetosiphonaceae bacterium]|nr:isoprenylcysteine carboxylmethyltransferase family protein [Herpetosiphonaceae bacterium]
MTEKRDTAGIVAPPPLIYGGTLIVGLLLNRLLPVAFLPRNVARRVGALLIGLNFLVGMPAFMNMRRAGTSPNPATPTTAIVTTGPYRYTRNPIYLSFTVMYIGIATFANALWALLLLPGVLAVMNQGVISREEQYLERVFGKEYTEYKARVRRWL